MSLLDALAADAIEAAVAFWLYPEDEGWERWRLVAGSPTVSPAGDVLRLAFERDEEVFELALVRRGAHHFVKYDDHDEPAREFPARVLEAEDEFVVSFVHEDQTVFVHVEIAV